MEQPRAWYRRITVNRVMLIDAGAIVGHISIQAPNALKAFHKGVGMRHSDRNNKLQGVFAPRG